MNQIWIRIPEGLEVIELNELNESRFTLNYIFFFLEEKKKS